jgi:hypothetical protein
MRAWSSGATPIPASLTVNRARASSTSTTSTATMMGLPGPYFIAFVSRFVTT